MNNCSCAEKSSITAVPCYICHIHLYTENKGVAYNVCYALQETNSICLQKINSMTKSPKSSDVTIPKFVVCFYCNMDFRSFIYE